MLVFQESDWFSSSFNQRMRRSGNASRNGVENRDFKHTSSEISQMTMDTPRSVKRRLISLLL
jgi:hypothetical protein